MMFTEVSRTHWRRLLALLMCLWLAPLYAQVPIPLQEQVQLFNQLPAQQQRQLIRELQSQLPPAQRDAVVGMLQQQSGQQVDAEPADGVEGARAAAPGTQAAPAPSVDVEPRLEAGSTVVLQFSLREAANADVAVEDRLERLADGNPYTLDRSGQIFLPAVPPIALAGLSESEARIRLQAEPMLRPFEIGVVVLPLADVGTDALDLFGYDLFGRVPSTFTPITDIPVPADYVIGPGDTITVQLFGAQNAEYFFTVTREGVVNFPELGPVNVAGLQFSELREFINQQVEERLIGVRASVTLGELRSIRVFVLGDVARAGSYTVGGLTTMTNALFASGGVTRIGSLRNIELLREGETASRLDLYDLLLRGDTSGDVRLQPGDVIFVPPIGPTVAVDGEVRRPAIYEIRDENTVGEIVGLAGGLRANANRSRVKLERVVMGGTRVQDIDLSTASGLGERLADGDVLRVQPVLDQLEASVRLEGNVHRPGLYEWRQGMRIGDLLSSAELLKPMSDLRYVLIRREVVPNIDTDVLSVDLEAIWNRTAIDIDLQPRDTVYVFNQEIGREHIVDPILDELQAQLPSGDPLPTVSIGGRVRAGGRYPLEPNMRVSDLIRAGGGMTDSAYGVEAELIRYDVVDGEQRQTELVTVDLAALRAGNNEADIRVGPYDHLNIKEVPNWGEEPTVAIRGEIRFPGEYRIRQGETLSSVLSRAGGLTSIAFPAGGIFMREDLREREREQLEVLARRIESDLAATSLADPGSADALAIGQTLIQQLRNAEPVGRLVIELDALVRGDLSADIVLRDGDTLLVPQLTQEVMVLGEVQYSTSHVYSSALSRSDYISLSGGTTRRADDKRTYVVRANGSVVVDSGARWFRRTGGGSIRPGDTIVVPLDTDRVRPLVFWQGVTQILYNTAIAVSAINSLN